MINKLQIHKEFRSKLRKERKILDSDKYKFKIEIENTGLPEIEIYETTLSKIDRESKEIGNSIILAVVKRIQLIMHKTSNIMYKFKIFLNYFKFKVRMNIILLMK